MFEISEKYRKYLIELDFKDQKLYTVWGTDMTDASESDKLLVFDNKLLCFRRPTQIKQIAPNYIFNYNRFQLFDSSNFANWLNREELEKPYTTFKIFLLREYNPELLLDKENATNLLDTLNLLYDFFEQIQNKKALQILRSKEITDVKEFLNNNYVWLLGQKQNHLVSLSTALGVNRDNQTKTDLEQLYHKLLDSIINFDQLSNRIAAS